MGYVYVIFEGDGGFFTEKAFADFASAYEYVESRKNRVTREPIEMIKDFDAALRMIMEDDDVDDHEVRVSDYRSGIFIHRLELVSNGLAFSNFLKNGLAEA